MTEEAKAPTLLRTEEGRLRVGWRLLLFLGVAAGMMLAVLSVLPASIVSGSVAMLVGALVGGWTLLGIEGRAPGALGFPLVRRGLAEVAYGVAGGAMLGLLAVGAIAMAGGVRWTTTEGSILGWMTAGGGALLFLALPAAAEEALLRGYPLQSLGEIWGPWPALAATSVAFGLLHLGNPEVTPLGALNVAVAGALLGVIYLKTGSLWLASGVHLGWNWAHAFLVDLPVSGLELFDAPFYDGSILGPGWLGGGAFGPEGSALTTLVLVGAGVAIAKGRRLRPSAEVIALRPLALLR